jgi:LPS-assembly lipoprotein
VDRNGKALAYMLTYWVRFAAEDRDGRQLIAPTDLTLERTFDDNPDVAVLGKQEEADMIYADMAEDAADQLLLRLRAALASRASPGASPGA